MKTNLPIDHISISSAIKFADNQEAWRMQYIDGIRFQPSVNMAIGKATHKVIERFYKLNSSLDDLKTAGEIFFDEEIKDIQEEDKKIEKARADFQRGVETFFENAPKIDEIIAMEERIEWDIHAGLLAVGIPDLVARRGNEIVVYDHKTTSRAVAEQIEVKPAYYIQAGIYFALVDAKYNLKPKKMVFNQIKVTNSVERVGKPKLPNWSQYEILNTSDVRAVALEFVRRVVKLIEFGVYVPNINGRDALASWNSFAEMATLDSNNLPF